MSKALTSNVAVIYCRVSTKKQEDDGTSLETQEEKSREYCAKQGYIVLSVHLDVHTGAELDRPGLNAGLSAIRQGKASILVAYDLDRLSRNQTHMAVILHQVETHAGQIELVREKLEDTPIGRFIRNSMAFVAEVEREKIKERTVRGKRARAERGAIIPGPYPKYGFRYADETHKTYVTDKETAPVVEHIFNEVAQGVTHYDVARKLDNDHIMPPTAYYASIGLLPANRKPATKWSHSAINQMIHDPAYKGEMAAYRWKITKESKRNEHGEIKRVYVRRERKADSEAPNIPLPQSVCPAIISAGLWKQAQARTAQNKKESTRNAKHVEEALLSRGFVVCGYCGGPLATEYRKGINQAWYRCPRRKGSEYREVCCEGDLSVKVDAIDKDVWSKVQEIMLHPEYIQESVERWKAHNREQQAQTQERIDALNSLIEKNKAKRVKLVRMIENMDDEEDEDIMGRVKELGQQIQKFTVEKAQIEASIKENDKPQADKIKSMEAIMRAVVINSPEFLSYETKRNILHYLGVKVRVWRANDRMVEWSKEGGMRARWDVSFGWDGLNNGDKLHMAEKAGGDEFVCVTSVSAFQHDSCSSVD